MRSIYKIGVATGSMIVLFLFGSPVWADQASDAQALVGNLFAQAVVVVNDGALSQKDRDAKFRNLIEMSFDVPRISHFVLGHYADAATDAEIRDFNRLFVDWNVRQYDAAFREYKNIAMTMTSWRNDAPNVITVLAQFTDNDGAVVKLEWVTRRDQNGREWIIDVRAEGISLIAAERDEIGSVAYSGGGTVAGVNRAIGERLRLIDSPNP